MLIKRIPNIMLYYIIIYYFLNKYSYRLFLIKNITNNIFYLKLKL